MENDANPFMGFKGLAAGLPRDKENNFQISVICFAAYEPDEVDGIFEVEDSEKRDKLYKEFLIRTLKESDPIFADFMSPQNLEKEKIEFFLGDEDEQLENFFAKNEDVIEDFLEDEDLYPVGGLIFKSENKTSKPSAEVEAFLKHLSKNYFVIPSDYGFH